jgi:hypothetical protein
MVITEINVEKRWDRAATSVRMSDLEMRKVQVARVICRVWQARRIRVAG